jgi:hypothetical protein
MNALIDGHNAIHRMGLDADTHEAQRRELLRRVRSVDPSATVYFDARGAPPGLPEVLREAGVAVRYCKREEADAAILREVRDAPRPGRLVVVTDDSEVAGRARSLGARSSSVWRWFAQAREEEEEESRPEGPPGFRPGDFDLPDEVDTGDPPAGLG